jgi:hypothetical protein
VHRTSHSLGEITTECRYVGGGSEELAILPFYILAFGNLLGREEKS